MKQAGLLFHGGLLIVGAVVAWWAWHDDEPALKEGSGPVLAEIETKDIEQLKFTWPEGDVTVEPQPGGGELAWAVTLVHDETEKPEKPVDKGDAGPGDAGPAEASEPVTKTVTSRFPGGRQLVRSIEKLAPLQARRSLGAVEAGRLGKMGLEKPERKLVLRAKGKSWTFAIGDSTYGDQARYARLEGRDDVLLLESAAVRGFEGTVARLMEPRVAPVPLDDVVAFTVRVGDREARFEHKDRDQPKLRHFVVAGATDERSEEAQGLMATLRGLRAKEYVGQEALAGLTGVGALRIELAEGSPLDVNVYEMASGSGYLVQAGGWIGEVPASRGKNLVDDMTAATPAQ